MQKGIFLNLSKIVMLIATEQENLHKKYAFCTEYHNAQKDRKIGRSPNVGKSYLYKSSQKIQKKLVNFVNILYNHFTKTI